MALVNIINELIVEDINSSSEFYIKYFNFKKDEEVDGWIKLTNNNCTLELMEKNEFIKELNTYPSQVINGNLIALKYDNLNEVNEIYKTLKDDNITFYKDYIKESYGSIEFGIYDNNQNMILIIYKEH